MIVLNSDLDSSSSWSWTDLSAENATSRNSGFSWEVQCFINSRKLNDDVMEQGTQLNHIPRYLRNLRIWNTNTYYPFLFTSGSAAQTPVPGYDAIYIKKKKQNWTTYLICLEVWWNWFKIKETNFTIGIHNISYYTFIDSAFPSKAFHTHSDSHSRAGFNLCCSWWFLIMKVMITAVALWYAVLM